MSFSFFTVGCLEKYTAYHENDNHTIHSTSVESCQRICYHDKDCEVFTFTVKASDTDNGLCKKKTSRGKHKQKGMKKRVAKDKISGAGRVSCPGIVKHIYTALSTYILF